MKAASPPSAADSVGVATPKKISPMTVPGPYRQLARGDIGRRQLGLEIGADQDVQGVQHGHQQAGADDRDQEVADRELADGGQQHAQRRGRNHDREAAGAEDRADRHRLGVAALLHVRDQDLAQHGGAGDARPGQGREHGAAPHRQHQLVEPGEAVPEHVDADDVDGQEGEGDGHAHRQQHHQAGEDRGEDLVPLHGAPAIRARARPLPAAARRRHPPTGRHANGRPGAG